MVFKQFTDNIVTKVRKWFCLHDNKLGFGTVLNSVIVVLSSTELSE